MTNMNASIISSPLPKRSAISSRMAYHPKETGGTYIQAFIPLPPVVSELRWLSGRQPVKREHSHSSHFSLCQLFVHWSSAQLFDHIPDTGRADDRNDPVDGAAQPPRAPFQDE